MRQSTIIANFRVEKENLIFFCRLRRPIMLRLCHFVIDWIYSCLSMWMTDIFHCRFGSFGRASIQVGIILLFDDLLWMWKTRKIHLPCEFDSILIDKQKRSRIKYRKCNEQKLLKLSKWKTFVPPFAFVFSTTKSIGWKQVEIVQCGGIDSFFSGSTWCQQRTFTNDRHYCKKIDIDSCETITSNWIERFNHRKVWLECRSHFYVFLRWFYENIFLHCIIFFFDQFHSHVAQVLCMNRLQVSSIVYHVCKYLYYNASFNRFVTIQLSNFHSISRKTISENVRISKKIHSSEWIDDRRNWINFELIWCAK